MKVKAMMSVNELKKINPDTKAKTEMTQKAIEKEKRLVRGMTNVWG
jgi:hypothetical protein